MGQSAARATMGESTTEPFAQPPTAKASPEYFQGNIVVDRNGDRWTLQEEIRESTWFVTRVDHSGSNTLFESEFRLESKGQEQVLGEAPLEDLLGITDPEMRGVVQRLKLDNKAQYDQMSRDVVSGDHELVTNVNTQLLDLQDAANRLVTRPEGGAYWMPRANWNRYDHVKTIVQDEGLDANLAVNYLEQLRSATVVNYTPGNKGTPELAELIRNSLGVTTAELSVLIHRLRGFAQEGLSPKEPWHDLYSEYEDILNALASSSPPVMGLADLAKGMYQVLGAMAWGEPDLTEKAPDYPLDIFGFLGNTDFYTDDYYGTISGFDYDPDTAGIIYDLRAQLEDSRDEYLAEEHTIPVPENYHLYATEPVLSHTGVFDPLIPLFAWFANSKTAVTRLRYTLLPIPDTNEEMVLLSTAAFVTRLGSRFLDLDDFPNIHLMLDPFVLAPIVIATTSYHVADIMVYPFAIQKDPPNDSFWVNARDTETDQLISETLHTKSSFLGLLVKEALNSGAVSLTEPTDEETMQERAWDIRKKLKGLINDPNASWIGESLPYSEEQTGAEYVERILADLGTYEVGKMTAERWVGKTAADISIMANQARAQAAASMSRKGTDVLMSSIKGLEGLESIGPGIISAVELEILLDTFKLGDIRRQGYGDGGDLTERVLRPDEGLQLPTVTTTPESRQAYYDLIDALDFEITVPEEEQPKERELLDLTIGLSADPIVSDLLELTVYQYEDGGVWWVPFDATGPFYTDEEPTEKRWTGKDGKIRDDYADGRSYEYPPQFVTLDLQTNLLRIVLPSENNGNPGYNTFTFDSGAAWLIPVELEDYGTRAKDPTERRVEREGRTVDIYADGKIYIYPREDRGWKLWPPAPPAPPVDEAAREEARQKQKDEDEWEEYRALHPAINWLALGDGNY